MSEPAHLLMIEDDTALYELFAEELQPHTIDIAGDYLTALDKLIEGSYQLVLLDLRLPSYATDPEPDMEVGFSILRQLRENPAWTHLPVIVMTAYERTSELTKRALMNGATEYWNKNGSYTETLPDMVNRVLSRQRRVKRRGTRHLETHSHRLVFSTAEQTVQVDGLVTFRHQSFRFLWELRTKFLAAQEQEEEVMYYQTGKLADTLDVDKDYLRKIVIRMRTRLATAYRQKHSAEPAADAIVQSHRWDGYRLNPERVVIIDLPVRS